MIEGLWFLALGFVTTLLIGLTAVMASDMWYCWWHEQRKHEIRRRRAAGGGNVDQ